MSKICPVKPTEVMRVSVEDESKIDEALELVLTASEKAEVMRALK